MPPQIPQQENLTKVIEKTSNGVVIEEFVNAEGKIVRQMSFTREKLTSMKTQIQIAYDSDMERINAMFTVLDAE